MPTVKQVWVNHIASAAAAASEVATPLFFDDWDHTDDFYAEGGWTWSGINNKSSTEEAYSGTKSQKHGLYRTDPTQDPWPERRFTESTAAQEGHLWFEWRALFKGWYHYDHDDLSVSATGCSVSASSTTVTCDSTTGLVLYGAVSIPGAGAGGAALEAFVLSIDSATQFTISQAASTTVSGVTAGPRSTDTYHAKFFGAWGEGYSTEGRPKIVLELWPEANGSGNSYLRVLRNHDGVGSPSTQLTTISNVVGPTGTVGLNEWSRWRVEFYIGSGFQADDGILRIWLNDTLIYENLALDTYGSTYPFIDAGYNVGYTNHPIGHPDAAAFIDDFKIYKANPAWGGWRANEPAGQTTFQHTRDFLSEAPDTGPVPAEWYSSPYQGEAGVTEGFNIIENYPGAPRSPSRIGMMAYMPVQTADGTAPGWTGYTAHQEQGATKIYKCFWMKVSDDFQYHNSGSKIGFCTIDGYGGGGDPMIIQLAPFVQPVVRVINQGPLGTEILPENVGTVPFYSGEWFLIEYFVVCNSAAGVLDGELHLWVNGVKTTEYTNVEWTNTDFVWNGSVKWEPTWGGVGDELVTACEMYMSEIYISGGT